MVDHMEAVNSTRAQHSAQQLEREKRKKKAGMDFDSSSFLRDFQEASKDNIAREYALHPL